MVSMYIFIIILFSKYSNYIVKSFVVHIKDHNYVSSYVQNCNHTFL